jgi:hypothetical protein
MQATGHRGGADANPADYILDCLAGLELDDVRALKSNMPHVTRPPMKHTGRQTRGAWAADRNTIGPPFRKRFWVIFRRRLREIRRNRKCVVTARPRHPGVSPSSQWTETSRSALVGDRTQCLLRSHQVRLHHHTHHNFAVRVA